jgi:hypothetical protein
MFANDVCPDCPTLIGNLFSHCALMSLLLKLVYYHVYGKNIEGVYVGSVHACMRA